MAKGRTTHKSEPVPAELRTERGSRKAQILRAQGKVPGILYGRGEAPMAIAVPGPLTTAILHSGSHTLDLVINGKTEKVLIKAAQYDYLQTTLEHIDLMRIDENQRVRVKVPLEFRGTPKGTKEGGILETQLTELELEVKVVEIPDIIRVNVENLEMHQIIHAKEVPLPAGAKLINYPEQIVCQVRIVKEEVAAVEAEAAPAEPEVIGKKKEEEGAEGAAPEAGKAAAAPAAPAKK